MTRKYINPWITNSFLDSCAFDPKYAPEDAAANEIFNIHNKEQLGVRIAHSTQKEIEHPNTPIWVKNEATGLIYTIKTSLTQDEIAIRGKIHETLTGNGNPENYEADATHIFEAQKYGSYFITTDGRILKFVRGLQNICNISILLPSDFLKLVRNNQKPSR